jgi:hypothetical protein
MIKDFLVSFKDNFKEKTRNPFLGTYLIVWLIRNWELVYTLFNFDQNQNLANKIDFIKTYYSNNNFLQNLWTNVYWSFGLLVLTYLLLNISRLITNLSEKRLTPWIYKITDSKSIVLKTEYNRIRTERDEIQFRLDQERDLKSKLENQIKRLENELTESKNRIPEEEITLESILPKSDIDNSLNILYEKLKERELIEKFKETATIINKGTLINNNEPIDGLIELGLIIFEKDSPYGGAKKYKLTDYGEKMLTKLRFE